jgi:hypothetical protein
LHRSLILLISLVLITIACSVSENTKLPKAPESGATPTVKTSKSHPTVAKPIVKSPTPFSSLTPSTATTTPFPSITPYVETPTQPSLSATSIYPEGVWRVRHDVERDDWGFKSRLWNSGRNKLRGLPETVRINGGKGTVALSPDWVKFLDKINTPDAQRYLRKLQSGWLNYGPFPKMEQLTFGGNLVEVTKIVGNKAYIKTFNNAAAPPATAPDTLIQTFSIVYSDGSWEMSTPVGVAYTFIIANPNDGPLWIDINNLIR